MISTGKMRELCQGRLKGAVNGTNSLDMKATDKSGRRWAASVSANFAPTSRHFLAAAFGFRVKNVHCAVDFASKMCYNTSQKAYMR